MLFVDFFFFKQKTAYEMRISDWSSDVCSSDLAMAAMILIEDGKLKLDQPISDFFPGFKNMKVLLHPDTSLESRPATRPITVRNLLTHTAGLGYTIVTPGPLLKENERRGITPGAIHSTEERRVGKDVVRKSRSGWTRHQ